MKRSWDDITILDKEAEVACLAMCKEALQEVPIRHETNLVKIYMRFLQMSIKSVVIGYVFFLGALLLAMSCYKVDGAFVNLYYAILGGYFMIQLFMHQRQHMEELLYTTSINGAVLFLMEMIGFLFAYTISCVICFSLSYETQYQSIQMLEMSTLQLLYALTCVFLLKTRLRSFTSALLLYIMIFALINLLFSSEPFLFSTLLYFSPSSIHLLLLTGGLLFLLSCCIQVKRLSKEGFYEANS